MREKQEVFYIDENNAVNSAALSAGMARFDYPRVALSAQ
jgi:hypothetical protein